MCTVRERERGDTHRLRFLKLLNRFIFIIIIIFYLTFIFCVLFVFMLFVPSVLVGCVLSRLTAVSGTGRLPAAAVPELQHYPLPGKQTKRLVVSLYSIETLCIFDWLISLTFKKKLFDFFFKFHFPLNGWLSFYLPLKWLFYWQLSNPPCFILVDFLDFYSNRVNCTFGCRTPTPDRLVRFRAEPPIRRWLSSTLSAFTTEHGANRAV